MARSRGRQIYNPEIMEELKMTMTEESRAGMDDEATFRQKVNALQRFLNHGMSRFSIESWHHTLSDLFHVYKQQSPRGQPQPHVLTSLRGVADLRLLSRHVMLQRDGGSLRDVDTQALKHLDNFLSALLCLREANKCFTDLYQFLRRHYYDPVRAESAAHENRGPEQSTYDMSAKQFGILTLQQMSGSTGHKLRRTVADMADILSRWERIVSTDGDIDPNDLDAESQQDLLLLATTASFEPVLRLLPDMFAKFYKCLELAKQWWVLAHDIYPELPINRPATPAKAQRASSREVYGKDKVAVAARHTDSDADSSGMVNEKVAVTQLLQQVEEGITSKDNLLQALHDESQVLEKRERHFESLMEAYEKVTSELSEKTLQRKGLVIQREKISFPLQNQLTPRLASPHDDSSNKNSGNDNHLDSLIATTDRQIQLLQFQQSLLLQDYLLQLEIRPSLIRFAEDLRQRTEAAQQCLTEQKMEKLKLQTLLHDGVDVIEPDGTNSQISQHDSDNDQDSNNASMVTSERMNETTDERKIELSQLHSSNCQQGMGNTVSQDAKEEKANVGAARRKSQPVRSKDSVSTEETRPSSSRIENVKRRSRVEPRRLSLVGTPPHRGSKKNNMGPYSPISIDELMSKQCGGVKGSGHVKNEENADQSVVRPRAKSEPHAGKVSQQATSHVTSHVTSQPVRQLSTIHNTADTRSEKPLISKIALGQGNQPLVQRNQPSTDKKSSSHDDSVVKVSGDKRDTVKAANVKTVTNAPVSNTIKGDAPKRQPAMSIGQLQQAQSGTHLQSSVTTNYTKDHVPSSQSSQVRSKRSDGALTKSRPLETRKHSKELILSGESSQPKYKPTGDKDYTVQSKHEGNEVSQKRMTKPRQAQQGSATKIVSQTDDDRIDSKQSMVAESIKDKMSLPKTTQVQGQGQPLVSNNAAADKGKKTKLR